jgi:hydroxymethylpyrimidine/phosphomethylpyrimidine kinase
VGGSTRWGATEAIRKADHVADVIYHEGDWGKEAMIIILGRSATEVVQKALKIARKLDNGR